MFTFFKWVFWACVITLVASLALGGWLAHEVIGAADGPNWHLVLDDGASFDLGASDMALGLGGLLAALVVGAVALLIVPLVVIFSVGVPLLAVLLSLGAVVLALAGVSALLSAPVLLPLLFVWWLARRKPVALAPTVGAPT